MKQFILALAISLSFFQLGYSQTEYTFDNETLSLNTEVEGPLDLLWTSESRSFRFFIKDANEKLTELVNIKENGKFNNKYQSTLQSLTGADASKVKLTTYSLKQYINAYNKTKDTNYTVKEPTKLGLNLGLYGGATNNPFINNPNNTLNSITTLDLELTNKEHDSKHRGFFDIRYAAKSNKLPYSSVALGLGYRYRFIKTKRLNVFAQVKAATFTFSKVETTIQDPTDITKTINVNESSNSFDTPLMFGFNIDYKLGKGYLSLKYDSLYAVFLKNYNVPTDISLGYKFIL